MKIKKIQLSEKIATTITKKERLDANINKLIKMNLFLFLSRLDHCVAKISLYFIVRCANSSIMCMCVYFKYGSNP